MALNNVPLSGQSLGVTRVPINQNFSVISAAFLVDHVDYNVAGQGKHNKVTMPVQVAAPAFSAGENGIYNLLYATTTKNEVFVHKQAGGGTSDIPFTASILSATPTPPANAGSWTYLPSGLLLKSGSSTGTSGLITVTPTGGPNFTQILSVLVVPFQPTTSALTFSVWLYDINSANTFRVNKTSATGGFQFFAIGY